MSENFWFTVGMSALLGAFLTGFFNIAKDVIARKAEAKSIKNSLIAEIESLIFLMKIRRYKVEMESLLNALIDELEHNKDAIASITLHIDSNYNPVYKANVSKIGMLDTELASLIVKFHATIYSITCDFSEKAAFSQIGYSTNSIKQLIELFEDAEQLGQLVVKYRKMN